MSTRRSRDRGAGLRLEPDEQVLWKGQPRNDRWFQPNDVLLVPFSLMWGGFAVFWEISVLSNHAARQSVVAPIWGIPFVVVGLYLIVGRLFVRRWALANTSYAITDRRAVAIAPSFRGGYRESSVWLRSYPQIDRRGTGSMRGSLVIGATGLGPLPLGFLADSGWPGSGSLRGGGIVFSDIENPDRPYDLLRAQLSKAS